MQLVERLVQAIRDVAIYNPEVQVEPACILWPDKDRQWEAAIPRLLDEIPELIVLGSYSLEVRAGPAIWLRCAIAGKASEISLPDGCTPVLYLPGVSRQDLRAVENCPEHLKPLAELQYRGAIWSQVNAKDWTILAFLKSSQGGLGLQVAQDNNSKNAMLLSVDHLLDEDIESLTENWLDLEYFTTLLSGGDSVRDLLLWLDGGETYRNSLEENEWLAFVEVCKAQFAFNPELDGPLVAATKLATHDGPWQPVWDRFCEAPNRYANIPSRIRQTSMPRDMFMDKTGWPQWNQEQEDILRRDLASLGGMPTHEARDQIVVLSPRHSARRDLVWADIGEAPLALALEHLRVVAEVTNDHLASGTIDDLESGYTQSGWRADDAVVRSLGCVEKLEDLEAVIAGIRSIYLPWLIESARYLQKVVSEHGYPDKRVTSNTSNDFSEGECILFVDALRFDLGKGLLDILNQKGFQVEETFHWAPLPTVTATGKPVVSPVRNLIEGDDATADFEPSISATGKPATSQRLKKLLREAGWDVLEKGSTGTGRGHAWSEYGRIDREGHERGARLASHVDRLLNEVTDRISRLIEAGWTCVHIVTDHGWLLMPNGLPKSDLASVLTENKWGRCAVLKQGAATQEELFPWFWNPTEQFALADGVSVFIAGREYAHGGLSLQECLIPTLKVSEAPSSERLALARIVEIQWRGLRCTVRVEGISVGLSMDIRAQPGNPSATLLDSSSEIDSEGRTSAIVENEDLEGEEVAVVLISPNGELVGQAWTVVGGEDK